MTLGLALTLALAFSVFTAGADTDWPKTFEAWEKATGALSNVVTVLALAIGGGWAWRKYVSGRLNQPRLELTVSGELIDRGEPLLKVSLRIKNVGTVKASWLPKPSGLDYYTYEAGKSATPTARRVPWGEAGTTFGVFAKHSWVEPGSSVADTLVIRLPKEMKGLIKLDLVLVSATHDKEWHCVTIVETPAPASAAGQRESLKEGELK